MSKDTASASKAAAAADSGDATARENAAAATAATAAAPAADAATAASASAAADAADEDDPSNCPICAYIESGPCADPHVGWRLCKRDAKAEPGGGGGDWVERCEAQVCVLVHEAAAARALWAAGMGSRESACGRERPKKCARGFAAPGCLLHQTKRQAPNHKPTTTTPKHATNTT